MVIARLILHCSANVGFVCLRVRPSGDRELLTVRLEAALRTRWDRDWRECPQSVTDWKARRLCGPKPPPAPFKLTQLPPQILRTAVYAELPFYLACLWKCCELITHVPKKHDPVFVLTRQDNCCAFGSCSFRTLYVDTSVE